MDLDRVREEFLDALEDLDHPVWDRMLYGFYPPGIRRPQDGLIQVWSRHPLDGVHACTTCKQVKKENPYIIGLLERRNRARLRMLAS